MTTLLVVMAVGLASCGSSDHSTSPRSEPHSPPPEIPAGGDTVVVQVTHGGGIAGGPSPWDVPDISVYGDGRMLVPDPTVGPAGVREVAVSRAELTDLFTDAAEAGLLDDPALDTSGDDQCCDLGYTIIALTDTTTTHQLSVAGGDDGLTAAQLEARQAILDLDSRLETLAEQSDGSAYTPDELAVYAFAADPEPGVEPTPWPLDEPLIGDDPPIDPDDCQHITTDTATVLAAAQNLTRNIWASGGQTWDVAIRPLLPHEHDCP